MKRVRKIIERLLLGILFLFIECTPKQSDEFVIDGSIDMEHDGEMVMLFTLCGDSIISVDTTIIKKGAFKFQGNEYIRDLSVITTGNFPDKVLSAELILERGKIKVHLDSISEVSGPFLQPIYKSFHDSIIFLKKELGKTYQISDSKIEIISDSAWTKANITYMNYALRILRNNVNNAIGKQAFGHYAYVVNDEELNNVYALFDEITKLDPDIIFIINDRFAMRSEMIEREKREKPVFQDFELITIDGTTKKMSVYVGKSKYLFIDFWASWCSPCIADFPYLMDVYNIYHEKGLNVLGISFDTSETAWKKALETHHVSWEMVMAKDKEEMKKAFLMSGIPYGILLDDRGTIVEVGLRGQFLPLILKKYLE